MDDSCQSPTALIAYRDAAEQALRETEAKLDKLQIAYDLLLATNDDCERHNAELIRENARLLMRAEYLSIQLAEAK